MVYKINGQNKTEYFKSIIDTTKSTELKLKTLDSLIKYTKRKDLSSFAFYSEAYVNEALHEKKYEKAASKAIKAIFTINTRLSQPNRALKLINSIEKNISNIKDSFLLGSTYLKKGGVFFNLNKLEKAHEYYQLAINNFGQKDSIHVADAIYFSGQVNFELSNHIKAIENYTLASKYYENLGDKEYMFQTKESIISIYGTNGFNEKTIKERERLIKEVLALNFTKPLGTYYYNLSLSYKKLNNREKEKECLDLSLKYTNFHKTEHYKLPIIYSQISEYYSRGNNIKKAKEYLDFAHARLKNVTSNSYPYLFFERAKSLYLIKTKKYSEAEKLVLKLDKKAKSNRASFSMELNNFLYTIYKNTGKNNKALIHYKSYSKIKDSIRDITKLNALSYYQTLYETEKKEKEINSQKAKNKLLDEENKTKNKLLIFGGLGVILIFIIFYLYVNKQAIQRKKKMQEDFSQKLLLSQEDERKRISKDLHDSLGQSLLLIKNKISFSNDNSTTELVNGAIEEMRSISKDLHPFQLEDIGISRALENLIIQLDKNCEDIYIFGDIDIIKQPLSQEKEVNIFRIIQECLNNIIKHSKAKSAKISFIHQDNHISIVIKDNGIGFDFTEKYNDFKSLGLKTIKERVKLLKGTLKIDSNKNEGTIFTIILPD